MESLGALFGPYWPWPMVGGFSVTILSWTLIERVLRGAGIPRESLVSQVLPFISLFVGLLVMNLLRWVLS